MLKHISEQVAMPIMRRIGTAFGGYLVALGANSGTVDIIVAGIFAAMGLAFDLTLSSLERRKS